MFVLLISVELLTNFLLIKITQPFCSKTKLCLDLFYGCKHLSNLNETIKNTYMYFQIPCFFLSLSLSLFCGTKTYNCIANSVSCICVLPTL